MEKHLCHQIGQAIIDYIMVDEVDKVMVGMSDGKYSYAIFDILLKFKVFDIVAVNLDQEQTGFPDHVLPEYLVKLGIPFHIENQDTCSIVKRVIPEGKTTCGLFSPLRRGILRRVAKKDLIRWVTLRRQFSNITRTLRIWPACSVPLADPERPYSTSFARRKFVGIWHNQTMKDASGESCRRLQAGIDFVPTARSRTVPPARIEAFPKARMDFEKWESTLYRFSLPAEAVSPWAVYKSRDMSARLRML